MASVVRFLFPALLLVLFTCMNPQASKAFDEPMLSISTGNVSGVYYAAGSAVAKMHNKKRKEYNLRLLAESSEGSVANVQNVIDRTSAFGIAQSNALFFAQKGERYWQGSPHPNLRSVFGLYTEDYTVIAAADANIRTLADLRGKTVNIGEHGSSDALQSMGVFNLLGIDPATDLTVVEEPTYEASELLQNNDIDAYFYTVGHPNLSVLEASSGERKVTIVSPGQDVIDHLVALRSYILPTEVPIDYYPGVTNQEPVPTISVKAILFTSAETDEQVVYNMVKEVFADLDLFKRQHPAFANLTPEKMLSNLIIPLHPGAERYFKEAGLLP